MLAKVRILVIANFYDCLPLNARSRTDTKIVQCFSCFKVSQDNTKPNYQEQGKLRLVVIGLDNAGKTTLVNTLRGIDADTTPTYGFISQTIQSAGGVNVEVYDLGGGRSIRKIWERYYSEVFGAIFVIDAADRSRIEEAKLALSEMLCDHRMRGKPLLIFANKQDVDGAMQASDIVMNLGLMNNADNSENDASSTVAAPDQFSVIPCTARLKSGTSDSVDTSIRNGIAWLQTAIESDICNLNERVALQAAEQRAEEERKREERRKRVEQAKEDRLREEAEQQEISERETLSRNERTESPKDDDTSIDGKDVERNSTELINVSVNDDSYDDSYGSIQQENINGNGREYRDPQPELDIHVHKEQSHISLERSAVMKSVRTLQQPQNAQSDDSNIVLSIPGSYPSPQKTTNQNNTTAFFGEEYKASRSHPTKVPQHIVP